MNEELLTPAGIASARALLLNKHEWFLHVKPIAQFDAIKAQGLQPRHQGCAAKPEVIAALGDAAVNIICLRPKGTFDTTPRRGQTMYLMAVHRDDMPARLGLDWSYDGNWTLTPILQHDHPNASKEEIFCEIIRRRGSVVSYDAIPATALRVWNKGASQDDPAQWPKITEVEAAHVEQFD